MSTDADLIFTGELWNELLESVTSLASNAEVKLTATEDGDVNVDPGQAPVHDVFGERSAVRRKITGQEVERWGQRVADQSMTVLHRLRRFTPARRAPYAGAFKNVVELGTAAYLVDAAFPARTGINDSTSYGEVLWTRHRQALDQLAAAVLADAEATPAPGGQAGTGSGRGPHAKFTDEWVTRNHPNLAPDGGVPGAEHTIRRYGM